MFSQLLKQTRDMKLSDGRKSILIAKLGHNATVHGVLTCDILVLYSARSGTLVQRCWISARTAFSMPLVSTSLIIQLHIQHTHSTACAHTLTGLLDQLLHLEDNQTKCPSYAHTNNCKD